MRHTKLYNNQSSFWILLVENCDLSEDRRTPTQFHFRTIDSQWRALFCIDHDRVKWRAKVFSSHCKAYFGRPFLLYKTNRLHFAVDVSVIDTRYTSQCGKNISDPLA